MKRYDQKDIELVTIALHEELLPSNLKIVMQLYVSMSFSSVNYQVTFENKGKQHLHQ